MSVIKFDQVIKNVCEKKSLNPELMKSFSDFIFSSTKQEMSKFGQLRIYLRGFIIFFYGFKRLKDFKIKVDNKIDDTKKGVKTKYKISFLENQNDEQLIQTQSKVDDLLKVYEEYILDKKTTKAKFKEDKINKV